MLSPSAAHLYSQTPELEVSYDDPQELSEEEGMVIHLGSSPGPHKYRWVQVTEAYDYLDDRLLYELEYKLSPILGTPDKSGDFVVRTCEKRQKRLKEMSGK